MTKRILSTIITVITAVSFFSLCVSALPVPTGEVDGKTTEIFEGVYQTSFALEGSPYGKQKVNVIEFDLAQRNLDVEILKGDYIVSKKTMLNYVKDYNTANASNGKEVIAAVNGDLWMTSVHSNTSVTKSVLQVPRGILMSDGVLYCSSQTANEATYATNGEKHSYFWAFGIRDDYVPMVGKPVLTFTVENTTKSISATTKCFNRLPAHDSLVIYDGNCNYTNYALDDAYEVVLNNVVGEFRFGTTITGTVSAIYSSSDGTSPTLTKDSIVLTARGTKIDAIDDYEIGDNISINFTVKDLSGRNNQWERAVTAIGGHIPLTLDGKSTNPSGSFTYPSTWVGFKNDGTVIFLQNDGRQSLWSEGLKFINADDLAMQLGINSVINLDGGGSSTMIVGDELVNKPSDGSARTVINGIALVSCPEREEQGEFEPVLPYKFDARYLNFENEGALAQLDTRNSNDTVATLGEGYVRLAPSKSSNDPFIYYSVEGAYNAITANRYKYMICKYRTSENVTTPSTELYLCAGTTTGPTVGCSVTFEHGTSGQWNTQIVDLSQLSYWSGGIYGVRIDYFAGDAATDEFFDLEYIAFVKTIEEANAYAAGNGAIPTVPPENLEITPNINSDAKIENGILSGIKSFSVAYDVINSVNGLKLEVHDTEGNVIRNQSVATGYTISSYGLNLQKGVTLTIAIKGDLNGDGSTDNIDASMVLRYDAGTEDLTDLQLAAGDVNADGFVDNLDAAYILKIDAGLIE